jgi:hypothetical protein
MLNKTRYWKGKHSLIHQVFNKRMFFKISVFLLVLSTSMQAQIQPAQNNTDTSDYSRSMENTKGVMPDGVLCLYTITASSGSNGTVTPAGVTEIESNTNKVYTITPAPEYRVTDVLVDGV